MFYKKKFYKVKAENMDLMAENHALKVENNDILQRLKAAEDLSKQQKIEMSLLKAEIIALKEVKNFEIRSFRKKWKKRFRKYENLKIARLITNLSQKRYHESITETQINQHNPFPPP